jgi:hypothetical protein
MPFHVLQRPHWHGTPVAMGDLFILHKNRREAKAVLFTHQLGWEHWRGVEGGDGREGVAGSTIPTESSSPNWTTSAPFRGHRPSALLLSMSECASQCLDAIRVRAMRSAAKRQATRGALGFWVGITTSAATHLTTALVASVVLRPVGQSTPSDSTSAMRVPISCEGLVSLPSCAVNRSSPVHVAHSHFKTDGVHVASRG